MIGFFVTVLCFVAAGHAATHDCEELAKPLEQLDVNSTYGQWGLVAASLKDPAATENFKARQSMTVYFTNSSYTHVFRLASGCQYHTSQIQMDGVNFTMSVTNINITGYFLHAPCPHCGVLSLDIKAPTFSSKDIYLFSRKRQLEESVMDEFKAQVACLKMPEVFMMDPAMELCPEEQAPAASAGDVAAEAQQGQENQTH